MEYLKSVNSSLRKSNEKNIQYLNIFNQPSLVFGTNNFSDKVDFCKYPKNVQHEIKKLHPNINFFMQYHKTSPCGCRIRFKTNSKRLIFKIKLKRGYNYKDFVMLNSSALTVYLVDKNGNYKFHKAIVSSAGIQCFAEEIPLPPNSAVCIFLPNFDTIHDMRIGFERGSKIYKFPYPKTKRKPILFYGGNTTQGASATKNSNSYPNIVSKMLNHDIVNFSVDRCCKATSSMADMIGKTECDSIVIDYSNDASNLEEFTERYEKFYKKVRTMHPEEKIILMTTASFNKFKKYEGFDSVIRLTYENAISHNENTFLLNQMELFDERDYDIVSFNKGNYTDYGMFKVAEKICEILKL